MLSKNPQQLLEASFSFKTFKCGVQIPNLKEQLLKYFIGTFEIYEKLFSVIKNQRSFYTKPEPLRHPLMFYFGHTAAFFVNKLLDKGLISQRINQSYERMFAVGVDEMDWDDLNESHYEWPSVPEAKAFRQKVKKLVVQIIQKSQQTTINWNSDLWIILMGIEHERIHLQTSSVIMRRLPISQVQKPEWFRECPHSVKQLSKTPVNLMKTIKQFQKEWDRQKQSTNTYGWDNEFGHKTIKTQQYSASHMLVSNGQFFGFFKDNGYSKTEYWSQEGKFWLKSTKVSKPLFWEIEYSNAQDAEYLLRTITDVIQMPWDWPVQVNNLQAQAFCRWKGQQTGKSLRLPTQDQYYAMRDLLKKDLNQWEPKEVGNINLEYWLSPNPVDMFETEGFFDVVGNVWQHTVNPIYPFEGFQIHPFYEDFTTPTFDNRHNIIKGGSFISTGNQALYHARYAFRRHFYQFAGFRYVESLNQTQVLSADIDQSDESVLKALKTQYTNQQSYIQKTVKFIQEKVNKSDIKKSLVAGCSVGRLPLELSKMFQSSSGIDYTARYFQMATRLLEQNSLKYMDVQIKLNSFGLTQQNYRKVHLHQMNPENTDVKKINEIDFLVIDGLSIRNNTLLKVLQSSLKLFSSSKPVQILLITDHSRSQSSISQTLAAQKFIQSSIQQHQFGVQSSQQYQKFTLFQISGQIN